MATFIDGRTLADGLLHELRGKVATLGFTPKLGVILVGSDPASHLYVGLKEKAAAKVGIAVEKVLLPAEVPLHDVIAQVKKFNQQESIDAVLIQLPLPPGLDEQTVIASLDVRKDADGFHPQNIAELIAGKPATTPGLAEGIVRLIASTGLELHGKLTTLVVNSQEFAQPVASLLHGQGVNTSTVYQTGPELRQADIIIVAVGRPGTIHAEQVKDGAVVIDVGTTKVGNRVVGDVASEEFAHRNVYLTPVPGGVGPMTVAMLLWNVYRLAARRRSRPG